nr:L-fucose/L-arabinose isomerase family protein [Rhodococcus sp. (in: high G+C Gram-positive bacteria)]
MALTRKAASQTRIGLVSGGLGAYWPQFPGLLATLQESAKYVTERFEKQDCVVVDAGFVSDPLESASAAETLRAADCDLVVVFLTTYLTSSMVLPIAQRVDSPVLLIDLQPTEAMDHATTGTGEWLAYCGQCPLPEVANVFRRSGIDFRSVSGYLRDENAWSRIDAWVGAASARAALRHARLGLMGHLYPGMLDISTDMTSLSAQFGAHVEVLEFDYLRVRVDGVTDSEVAERLDLARSVFTLDDSVDEGDLAWGARVSVGLDRVVDDFGLDAMAYYHRGLGGELHERLGAGMILGASLLTARGIPMAGEYDIRTAVAMLVADRLGAGGSFTELQALNFRDGVVEMGHDGPAHLQISSGQPLLRGLGVYHGKRGYGVSVEFDVEPGPVTTFSVGQNRDGSYTFITSEGTVVPGPLLQIGNTTSRVDFGRDPGEWTDDWSATGTGHHWALCTGHRARDIKAAAELLGIAYVGV